MDVDKTLLDVFSQSGIILDENDKNMSLELDSIQFMTLIVAIEAAFSIAIEEEYLSFEKLHTFNDFLKVIKLYLGL